MISARGRIFALTAALSSVACIAVPYAAPTAPLALDVPQASRFRHGGNNKPAFDRKKQNRRNRLAATSRRRNRRK